jgi:hypothetical protein
MDKLEEVRALANIFALIRDDAYACSFQTLGQYRAALLRVIDKDVQKLFEEVNNEQV